MIGWLKRKWEQAVCEHDWRTYDRRPSRCLSIDGRAGAGVEVWSRPVLKQRCAKCGKDRTING